MSASKVGWCTWTCKPLKEEVQSTAGGQGRDQQVDEKVPREDEVYGRSGSLHMI